MNSQNQIPRAVAGALIFDDQGRLFLMRSSGKYNDEWIIPGGKVDFGESMVNALKREIFEETNMTLKNIRFGGVRELIEPSRHFIFLEFLADVEDSSSVKLNYEATEFGWFTRAEIDSLKVAAPTMALINERFEFHMTT